MSDPQTRAADMMASFFWAHSPEYVDHVAAKLAEAGLLTHDPDECAGHCRRVMKERDAARAELAQVKKQGLSLIAELQQVKAERDSLADWVRGYETMRWPEEAHRLQQQRNAALTSAEQAEAREAALREGVRALADEWRTAHGDPPVDPSHISVRHAERLLALIGDQP